VLCPITKQYREDSVGNGAHHHHRFTPNHVLSWLVLLQLSTRSKFIRKYILLMSDRFIEKRSQTQIVSGEWGPHHTIHDAITPFMKLYIDSMKCIL